MSVSLLVGTVKGGFVFRSDDSRKNWTLDQTLFKGWKVSAATRGTEDDYLVSTSSFVYGATVHRSKDLREFRQVEQSPAFQDSDELKLNEIWRMHRAGNLLYAGVDEAALFSSDDGGEHWHHVTGLTNQPSRKQWFPGFGGLCAHAILSDPQNHDRVWCGISAVGVFESTDRGRNWSTRNQGVPVIIEDKDHKGIGFCVHALASDPDDANRIWRQDHRGMFRSTDGGQNWERIENGLPSSFGFPLAIDRNTKTLYSFPLESDEFRMPVGGKFCVYRSRDAGDSWECLSDGLPQNDAYMGVLRCAMAVDHMNPCGVYVGSTAGTVHISADGGDSWQTLPGTFPRILMVEAFVEGA